MPRYVAYGEMRVDYALMEGTNGNLFPLRRSLSTRLLVLTVAFVMLSEVLIYVPSIARFRQSYLDERLAQAHLATLAMLAAPNNEVNDELEREMLFRVGARAIILKRPASRFLMLSDDMPARIDVTFDMRDPMPMELLMHTFDALVQPDDRLMRIIGEVSGATSTTVEVILPEAPLREAMFDFSWRILTLSIIISLFTAGLVYLSLSWLMVRPMARLTESMMRFRQRPEDASRIVQPSDRQDEIGQAQRELAVMQSALRDSLRQKTHLAALGTAVSKINHDLRNILAVAQLVSDRFVDSADPEVRRITPRLLSSIDRATSLCARTLKFGRADEPAPEKTRFALRPLIDEVALAVGGTGDDHTTWTNDIADDVEVFADHDQLFRVFLNLGRNAVQAAGPEVLIRVVCEPCEEGLAIDVIDNGPGLPEAAKQHLFEPFTGSARAGGTGLGLVIVKDLISAHGGTVDVRSTGPEGTVFRVILPA